MVTPTTSSQLEMFPKETIEEKVARLEGMVLALQAQVQDLTYLVTNQACRSPRYWQNPLPFYVGSDAGESGTNGWNIEK